MKETSSFKLILEINNQEALKIDIKDLFTVKENYQLKAWIDLNPLLKELKLVIKDEDYKAKVKDSLFSFKSKLP